MNDLSIALLARLLSLLMMALIGPELLAQGPLTPPPGPPGPLMKSLTEVEPRVAVESLTGVTSDCLYLIAKPGSYYLTANITGVRGASGIKITTDSVTLDLCGFQLIGVPGAHVGIVGQISSANRLRVRDGTIRNWGNGGINVGSYSVIENVTVTDNTGVGILADFGSLVGHCIIATNTSYGVDVSNNSAIENCQVLNNGAGGIDEAGFGGRVDQCVINSNSGYGIYQPFGGSCQISGNSIYANSLNGVYAQSGNHIVNNVINYNGGGARGSDGAGIYLGNGSNFVQGNHLLGNRYGIYAANVGKETVIGNVAIDSTVSNYIGNTGNNTATFGPVVTSAANMTTPAANLSNIP